MKIVAIAGGFDPIHSGHIDHIRKAKALGDRLVVLVCPDQVLIEKKGYCLVPLADRIAILDALPWVDEIYVGEYSDGSPLEPLKDLRPNIYAKGGDRAPDNMLQVEIDVCAEIGCEIVYGIGDLLNSSSEMFDNALRQLMNTKPRELLAYGGVTRWE